MDYTTDGLIWTALFFFGFFGLCVAGGFSWLTMHMMFERDEARAEVHRQKVLADDARSAAQQAAIHLGIANDAIAMMRAHLRESGLSLARDDRSDYWRIVSSGPAPLPGREYRTYVNRPSDTIYQVSPELTPEDIDVLFDFGTLTCSRFERALAISRQSMHRGMNADEFAHRIVDDLLLPLVRDLVTRGAFTELVFVENYHRHEVAVRASITAMRPAAGTDRFGDVERKLAEMAAKDAGRGYPSSIASFGELFDHRTRY